MYEDNKYQHIHIEETENGFSLEIAGRNYRKRFIAEDVEDLCEILKEELDKPRGF